ncbi:ENV1 protein, partial [Dasyornis broadbenti]|nr:ENV1 protein [Dasyornis broadbenti]
KADLCNTTMNITKTNGWLIPAPNTKWVCKTLGITPCISLNWFNSTHDYCVQVVIVPKIIYHPTDYVLDRQETTEHHITKREPISALTIAVLLTVGGVGAGTGIAAITSQHKQLQELRLAVDEDILKLEKSIDALVKSVRSLSEVVLQNRRGLDLLFMQQGGLCIALKEECCTYVDHTGVAIDTIAELRKQIERRKRDYEKQKSWYENWFNRSPWFTTLLSTIAGPLILSLLTLTFGPCIFNRVIAIVK